MESNGNKIIPATHFNQQILENWENTVLCLHPHQNIETMHRTDSSVIHNSPKLETVPGQCNECAHISKTDRDHIYTTY